MVTCVFKMTSLEILALGFEQNGEKLCKHGRTFTYVRKTHKVSCWPFKGSLGKE